jgi:cytochrome c peroxidase
MKIRPVISAFAVVMCVGVMVTSLSGQGSAEDNQKGEGRSEDTLREGQRLFERETFGGNGRTCLTCHSRKTGTVSPRDAQARFQADPLDPLFLHDGSDDGNGHGATRMLADATVLMKIALPPNVQLAQSANRFAMVRRGIPTTLNTPALDPVLMVDGRQPSLELQAEGAIHDHAQGPNFPGLKDLELVRQFQMTDAFFSSPALRDFAVGGPRPKLPRGNTDSERRGRRFFEDLPPDPAAGFKPGLCAHCHSGPLMNQTNEFAPLFIGVPIPTGTRFIDVLVSFFNQANNPVQEFIFNPGAATEAHVFSADPGRALATGRVDDVDAFKISQLRGIRRTAPYFHDNSAKTLEDVAAHYARFFSFVTGGFITLTPQDQADMVAFMKLLD